MVRIAFFELSAGLLTVNCAWASSQCNCDLTLADNEFEVIPQQPLKVTSNTSEATSPVDAIDAVASQEADWSKTLTLLLKGGKEMAKDLGAGKLQVEDDLLKTLGGLIVEGAGMVNPLLGAMASFIYSFFQGLFGSDTDPYRKLYDMIMEKVKHMIHESEIRSEMKTVSDKIQGFILEEDYLKRTGQTPKAEFFYLNRPTVLDAQCLAKDWASTSCQEWEQHGSVVHGVLFAALHLQTLNEIAASFHGSNQTQVKVYLTELGKVGSDYVEILRHSLGTWFEHRMVQQRLNYWNEDVSGNCWNSHQGWCRAYSEDLYGATVAGCPACQTCIVDIHEEPQKTKSINWHNAWTQCHARHRAKLQTTMNKISTSIDGLAEMVAAAKGAAAPAPAPLPAFKDHLAIGQSLTPDKSLVSSNGWYSLLMQTDNNLVLYADSFDGVKNTEAKSVWSTGMAGAGAVLNFQKDGNLVLVDKNGNVKWDSKTTGKGGTKLLVQDDANLCLYGGAGGFQHAVWCSNTHPYGFESDLNATLV